VGKSFALRALARFRTERPDLFGGKPQLTVLASYNLVLAKALHNPALLDAEAKGWTVDRRNEARGIEAPDGSAWRTAALSALSGHTVNLLLLDEAWSLSPGAYEDRAQPTTLAADRAQIVLWSTAGTPGETKATPLVPKWRQDVFALMREPEPSRLLLEWSAPGDVDGVGTEEAWRAASPRWTKQRARMLRERARTADSKQDVMSFRAQYLNIWPSKSSTEGDRLVTPEALAGAVGDAPTGFSEPVIAVEDFYGKGAGVAVAERDSDGMVRVTGALFRTRAEAFDYVDAFCSDASRAPAAVLVGAGMAVDPRVQSMVLTPEFRGLRETRQALPLYRSMVEDAKVVHDHEAADLTRQLLDARVKTSSVGATLGQTRHDLAQAALWAIAEVVQLPPDPRVEAP
jgi:hypothetical protein